MKGLTSNVLYMNVETIFVFSCKLFVVILTQNERDSIINLNNLLRQVTVLISFTALCLICYFGTHPLVDFTPTHSCEVMWPNKVTDLLNINFMSIHVYNLWVGVRGGRRGHIKWTPGVWCMLLSRNTRNAQVSVLLGKVIPTLSFHSPSHHKSLPNNPGGH